VSNFHLGAVTVFVWYLFQAKPVNKDRFISKMFLRGDSVILVLRNPLATAGAK
jgi:hypothetical protein